MSKLNKIKINDVSYEIQDLSIGNLEELDTENKSSIVDAINEVVNSDGGESSSIYDFTLTTELPELDYTIQEVYDVELNEEDVSNLEEFINIYADEKCILNVNFDGMVLWTFTDTLANVEMLDETNFSLNLETKRIENVSLIINGTFDGTLYIVTNALLNIAMGDIDYINNRLAELEENGGNQFINLDLIVSYASAGSNPLPINSTKNASELEKLSKFVNEYVTEPKPIILSIFNEIGTVYRDHYNILVTTFGTAITPTAKNPSLKYTILNGYKATPFTLSISGTWTDGVYNCTSASITYDNTKDLMGTTEFSTITGRKVFNTLPETNVKATSSNQFTNKQYVDDAIKNAITNVLEADY